MKKFTAIEWQSFALKKDIETIVKKLNSNRVIQFSLLIEVALVILGAVLAKIFNGITQHKVFWLILLVLSMTPFIILFIKWIKNKYDKSKPGYDQMNDKDFIDIFDNEITYYILISDSYYSMLLEALSHKKIHPDEISDNIIHFYYIQTSYYFKKAIADLDSIHNIANKVLSNRVEDLVAKRIILIPRYYNARDLLIEIYNNIESLKDVLNNLDKGNLIIESNKKFKENLDRIDRAVSEASRNN